MLNNLRTHMGKISLSNIAEELAEKSNLTRDVADSFIHAFVEAIEKGLQEDNVVKIKGLGTFKLQEVSDRESVDVNTGERIMIKGYRKVAFTPDSAMKEFVNRPFAHFEPTELNDGYPTDEEPETSADENDDVEVVNVEKVAEKEAVEPTEEVDSTLSTGVMGTTEITEVVEAADEAVVAPSEEESDDSHDEDYGSTEEVSMAANESSEIEVAEVEEEQQEAVEANSTEAVGLCQKTEEMEVAETPETKVVEAEVHASPPAEKIKKRRGCGCLSGVLFVVLIFIVLLVGWFVLETDMSHPEGVEEVHSNMMVNPNLEEELGMEWADEPQVEPELPTERDSVSAVHEEPSPSDQKTDSVEQKLPQASTAVALSADAKYCTVTITESLQGKTIKDISPADTTDYIISGTLVTHELKRGETIIQLAVKYYGDKRLWPYIVKYNWMKDFNNVAIGQMINIPVLKDKPAE